MLGLRACCQETARIKAANSSITTLLATRLCRAHAHYATSTLIILAHFKSGASDDYVTTRHRSEPAVRFPPISPPSPTLCSYASTLPHIDYRQPNLPLTLPTGQIPHSDPTLLTAFKFPSPSYPPPTMHHVQWFQSHQSHASTRLTPPCRMRPIPRRQLLCPPPLTPFPLLCLSRSPSIFFCALLCS